MTTIFDQIGTDTAPVAGVAVTISRLTGTGDPIRGVNWTTTVVTTATSGSDGKWTATVPPNTGQYDFYLLAYGPIRLAVNVPDSPDVLAVRDHLTRPLFPVPGLNLGTLNPSGQTEALLEATLSTTGSVDLSAYKTGVQSDATYAPKLTPTATKTAAYTVGGGELAMMNVAGGGTVLTLPNAPADRTIVGVRAIGATATLPLTINRGGTTDTIGTAGATTASVPLDGENSVLQYDAANTRWLTAGPNKPQAALDTRYAFSSLPEINVKNNPWANMLGDGVTNDQPAFQAIVNGAGALYASDGIPRKLTAPPGVFSLRDHGTVWKSGVSLCGAGPGMTRFLLANTGDSTNPTPLATFTVAQQSASATNFLADCTFRDFEIDGSGVTTTSGGTPAYNVGAKGLTLQFMLRARFINLYIHDCAATGLGCDFLQDSIIDNVVANNNGRQNSGSQIGGAGIGIGVGGWGAVERTTVNNVTCVGNGTHGLFFEIQNSGWTRPKGIRVNNAHVEGNTHGMSDWGCDGLLVDNVTSINNLLDGYNVSASGVGSLGGQNGRIGPTCVFDGNGLDGLLIGDLAHGYHLSPGMRASNNGRYGVHVSNTVQTAATANQMVSFDGLDVVGNGLDGVRVDAGLSDPFIVHLRTRNNGQQQSAAVSSTATSATALTLTDTAAAWAVNGHVGKTVTVGAQTALVRSNTATVLTLFALRPNGTTAWASGTPAASAAYSLPAAPTVRAGMTFNATVSHPVIRGGRYWDQQTTKTQTHGWAITSTGACTSGEVTDNDFLANLTGAASFTTAPSGGHFAGNNGLTSGSLASPGTTLIDGPLALTPTTSTTAPSAGAAGALPSAPTGYMTVSLAGTSRQIPYY